MIEVSVAYDVGNLVAKVNDCEGRWFRHLRTHFASGTVVGADWNYRVTIYIRSNSNFNPAKLDKTVSDSVDVMFFEDIGYPWQGWYAD